MRIQAVQRGKRARRGMAIKTADAHAARVRAAREEKERLMQENYAATRIQAVHRGKRGRRKVKKKKKRAVKPEPEPEPEPEPVDSESTALSPLPLISSYKSEKSLCGTVVAFNAALRRYDELYEEAARKREAEVKAAQLAASRKVAAELGKAFEGLLEEERAVPFPCNRLCITMRLEILGQIAPDIYQISPNA